MSDDAKRKGPEPRGALDPDPGGAGEGLGGLRFALDEAHGTIAAVWLLARIGLRRYWWVLVGLAIAAYFWKM